MKGACELVTKVLTVTSDREIILDCETSLSKECKIDLTEKIGVE